MKKHISLIGGLLLSTILISCSETKVLEENTKDNISEKYTITERNIENNDKEHLFTPVFYDEDRLYGVKMKDGGGNINEHTMLYYLDNTGDIKSVEDGKLTDEEIDFIKGNGGYESLGIYTQEIDGLKKYYYINLSDKTKIELKDFENIKNNIEINLKSYSINSSKINDKYYICQYVSHGEENLSEFKDFIILDIESNKYYSNSNEKKIRNFYYDDNLKSIIGIDKVGKMYKLKFEENNIILEDYKTINTDKLDLYDRETFFVSKISNNKLLLNIKSTFSKEYNDYFNAIYDIETEEVVYLDKEKTITNKINNTNFYFIIYKGEEYLGEISEDGNIKFIYKFDEDGYKYFNLVFNKEGNKAFLTRVRLTEDIIDENSLGENLKYFILEIQER